MKKTVALILSLVMLFSVVPLTANAQTSEKPAVTEQFSFGTVIEYIRGLIQSLFGGKTETTVKITDFEQGNIFNKGMKTDSAHASTVLLLPDGRYLSAWFGGTGEGNDDVRIWYAFFEDGKWSEPQKIATTDNLPHWNPVLQDFGTYARLYFKVGKDTASWVTKFSDYSYTEKTWSSVTELVPGDTSGGRGPVKNKCLVTSKGTIIAGASTEQGDWKAFFDISEDGGNTWKRTEYVETPKKLLKNVQMIQPTVWEDGSGIHAFFRTKSGRIYRSDSLDGGYSWCKAYETALPNNSSGIDCVMTDNGWLWLAYNPIKVNGIRNKLMLSVSKDGGNTWEDVKMLEKSLNLFAEFSYPAIIAEGNRIFITYTYKREIIKYVTFEFEG